MSEREETCEREKLRRVRWNSIGEANLTWRHLKEALKFLSASAFNLYIIDECNGWATI
jgi:hypothetical protein